MDKAIPACLVTSYEDLVDGLSLPDPDDRHVLAAAIRCGAGVIVTYNLKDFPDPALRPFGVQAQHPDEFIAGLFDLQPSEVLGAVKAQRSNLKNPPRSQDELLATLEVQRLPMTVARLRPFRDLF